MANRGLRPFAPALLLLAALPGCYTAHVVKSQLGILAGREQIADLLQREASRRAWRQWDEPGISDAQRAKLRLVLAVRRFAFQTIGLDESGSYSWVYDTHGQPIAWNVSASAPDALSPHGWRFPFLGTLPYIGFFRLELARAEARGLEARGLDALVLPVPAYSTLGWFDDPIFTSLLEREESRVAEVVIHELSHATVWIDGDAEFNENLAQFIGVQGAKDFFLARGGPNDPALLEARRKDADDKVFNAAMTKLRGELSRLYEASGSRARKLALKKEAFARFKRSFKTKIRPRLSDDGYDWVLDPRIALNNALLLQFRRYRGAHEQFEALHRKHGSNLRETVKVLKKLAEAKDPRAALQAAVGAAPKNQ